MAIKTEKFLSALYASTIRDKIKTRIALVGGPSRIINLTFNVRADGAWTSLDGRTKDRLRIYIGGQMVKKAANLPDQFTNKEAIKSLIEDIFKAFYALVYHELGHDIFTDMNSTEIIEYPEAKYRAFMHNMFNILEDQVIEYCMQLLFKKDFPYDVNPQVYFNFMIDSLFSSQGESYTDDKTQAGFLNYILLFLRIGEKKIRNKCEIFEKYRGDLVPLMKAVLQEPNGTKRVHNTVVLCEWIIKNITEFSWEMPAPDPKSILSGKTAKGTGIPAPSDGGFMPGGKKKGGVSPEEDTADKEGAEAEPDDEGGEEEPDKDVEEGKGGGGAEPDDKEEPEDDDEGDDDDEDEDFGEGRVEKEIDEDIYDEVFNDVLRDGDDHEWCIAKDEYEVVDGTLIDRINEIIDENTSTIKEVSDYLTLFKGRIKPIRTEGMTSGRLAVRRAIREEISGGCSTRIFQRKLARGRAADLVVSLVTDNSGSMNGRKSQICSRACIMLAQACDWSGIPFEINAFTKTSDTDSGISFTITEKGFEDSFESSKPFLAINDSSLIGGLRSDRYIPTFAGNSEEVNLYYIWQKFKKSKHKTKLMFVLCDGGTTGSRDSLRTVVRQMQEENGIIVIGIGILDTSVVGIYDNVKVFHTMKELEDELAPYLIDTLSQYAR